MAAGNSTDEGLIQTAYNRLLRPHLPRRLSVLNGVVARRARLLDATDHAPDYEAALIDALRTHVDTGDRVVIVGGGFGVSSVVAADEAGPDGKVSAYEASADHTDIVAETATLNDVDDRIDVRHAVVGTAVSTFGPVKRAPTISSRALPECDVLAIDCEGAELEILAEMVIRPPVVIVESHGHLGTPSDDVRAMLDACGYEIVSSEFEVPEEDVCVLTAVRE